jgi:hypothetical protein
MLLTLFVALPAAALATHAATPLPAPEALGEVGEGAEGAVRLAENLLVHHSAPGVGPRSAATAESFALYPAPNFIAFHDQAGETSVGVDLKTNNVMTQLSLTTAKVHFDDAQSPPKATWSDVTALNTGIITFDPILWTDPATSRTFVTQLVFPTTCNLAAYTDDDGATWVPMPIACSPAGIDHETIGGGAYAAPLNAVANPVYPSALFLCTQQGLVFGNGNGIGYCSRSDDGGLTFVPLPPMNDEQCGALFGHVVSGPDGRVYVPFRDCPGANGGRVQGVLTSGDNGLTWSRRTVEDMPAGLSDAKLAYDRNDQIWLTGSARLTDGQGNVLGNHVMVSHSTNDGQTWSPSVDLSALAGLQNGEFAEIVAGDPGRVAVAFYGAALAGDDQDNNYQGVWHLYSAITTDNGATWAITDITGSDPVQRGAICLGGLGCNGARNLLDFQDAAMDAQGRMVISFADGCTSAACTGPNGKPSDSTSSDGVLARQVGGSRLLAGFGP